MTVPVTYHLEPTGPAGEMQANGKTLRFCSESCRARVPLTTAMAHGDETLLDVPDGWRCDSCGASIHGEPPAEWTGCCDRCGGPFTVDATLAATHDSDEVDGIDGAVLDLDHVPYARQEEA